MVFRFMKDCETLGECQKEVYTQLKSKIAEVQSLCTIDLS